MAKILISSLGIGDKEKGYREATYEYKGQQKTTKVIAKALTEFLEIDKLYLVGTNGSYWDNCYNNFDGQDLDYELGLWDKIKQKKLKNDDLIPLSQAIDNYINSSSTECFLIDYGINDKQLWSNFEKYLEILEQIEDGDEVYIDITHSFRSLALMSFLMAQFGQVIKKKNFKVGGIFYGMLEYKDENNGITPIVDLKIFYDLMEWIRAIDAIKNYSDFKPLTTLLEDSGVEQKVNNTFINLNNTIQMANMSAMKQFVDTAHKKLSSIENSENRIIKLLAPEIIKLIDDLKHEKMSDFQFAIAKWFYKNDNFALSYMALSEAIVTKTCELKDYDSKSEDGRKEAKRHIDTPWDKLYSATKKQNGQTVRNEGSISDIRNNIAHQLGLNSDVSRDIKKLKEFIKTFESYFKK